MSYIRFMYLFQVCLQLQRALLLHAGVADAAYAESGSALLTKGFLPMSTELAIYGSSGNNFGSLGGVFHITVMSLCMNRNMIIIAGADLDMCLLFPKNALPSDLDAEKRGQVIERLGEALTSVRRML